MNIFLSNYKQHYEIIIFRYIACLPVLVTLETIGAKSVQYYYIII